jgi:hypothetical protein
MAVVSEGILLTVRATSPPKPIGPRAGSAQLSDAAIWMSWPTGRCP